MSIFEVLTAIVKMLMVPGSVLAAKFGFRHESSRLGTSGSSKSGRADDGKVNELLILDPWALSKPSNHQTSLGGPPSSKLVMKRTTVPRESNSMVKCEDLRP